jgi:hypothetical protein
MPVQVLSKSIRVRPGAPRGSDSNQFYVCHGFVKTHESKWDTDSMHRTVNHGRIRWVQNKTPSLSSHFPALPAVP